MRTGDFQGLTQLVLLVAKSRVALIKFLTRLQSELVGTVIGARLLDYTREAHWSVSLTYTMRSDSTVTPSWIHGDLRRCKTFVENRVEKILKLTDPMNWKFYPGDTIPADMLTRGVTVNML